MPESEVLPYLFNNTQSTAAAHPAANDWAAGGDASAGAPARWIAEERQLPAPAPQTFPTGQDVPSDAQVNPNREIYFNFTTVEFADFSGAFFQIRASDGISQNSRPKADFFE
ncbi:ACT domain-containing protein [Hymenobacter lapidiphilus]|uniref:hypothetical protein n=1 Tax=Hymenobacter sp. CCM 8763 TaxID=2303334 RepID=UPI0011C150CD|nr:hypothetical protein [Hymenobacter sp. CCM 8763]